MIILHTFWFKYHTQFQAFKKRHGISLFLRNSKTFFLASRSIYFSTEFEDFLISDRKLYMTLPRLSVQSFMFLIIFLKMSPPTFSHQKVLTTFPKKSKWKCTSQGKTNPSAHTNVNILIFRSCTKYWVKHIPVPNW